MKSTEIKDLLERYDNGGLSAEELEKLNSITHREDVMKSAMGMATQIRKKRRKTVSYVVTVMVLVCGVGLLMRPMWMEQEDIKIAMVAEDPVPVNTVVAESKVVEEPVATVKKVEAKVETAEHRTIIVTEEPVKSVIEKVSSSEIIVAPIENDINDVEVIQHDVEPQVLCNVQCDADSVINEVWNFLKV